MYVHQILKMELLQNVNQDLLYLAKDIVFFLFQIVFNTLKLNSMKMVILFVINAMMK